MMVGGKKASSSSTSQAKPALALRRLPIVVIPRKRKYKNYVSRRRNTQLLASLRRCVSDPHVYRSFNHWKSLWRPFSPNRRSVAAPPPPSPVPSMTATNEQQQQQQKKKPNPPAHATGVEQSAALLSPTDKIRKPQSLSESNSKANSTENGPTDVPPTAASASPLPPTKNISGKLTELKKQNSIKVVPKKEPKSAAPEPPTPEPQPKPSGAATSKPPTSSISKIEARRNSTKSVNAVAPLPEPKQPSTLTESAKKSDGIEFLPQDKPDEKPLASVKPQVQNPKSLRKAYGSKSGTTICAVGSPIGVPSTSNGIPPVEDEKRLIEKKLSLRRKKNDAPKETGTALLSISKSGVDLSKDHTDEQKAKKTVNQVAAAFSNQVAAVPATAAAAPVPADEPFKEPPPKPIAATAAAGIPPKPKSSVTQNLLAQLQLPASVSAKVDKIIASGDKAKRSNLSQARGRQPHAGGQPKTSTTTTSTTATSDAKKAVQDNKEGHLIYANGDTIGDYTIVNTLGEGTFGKVVRVTRKKDEKKGSDKVPNEKALKIIKALPKYRDAAKMEIKVLQKLKERDPGDKYFIIHLREWFDFHGHYCLVFDLLALSVYDYLKANSFRPYPMNQICHIAYQVCSALNFLHLQRLTHTDLKPENIMFLSCETTVVNADKNIKQLVKTDVRLIDFGSATFFNEHHTAIISTRHYRAPEVILELGWNESCDVWSMGCVLFELYTGFTLFQTHENREHLAMMERVVGPIPLRMCKLTKVKYFQNNKLEWTPNSEDAHYVRENCKPLRRSMVSLEPEDVELFELIELMLSYEPTARLPMKEAIEHRYFKRLTPSQKEPRPTGRP